MKALTEATDPPFVVRAVAARDAARAEAMIARWGLGSSARAFGSYDVLLDSAAALGLDALYIPLPSALHLPLVRRAASLGLHVLLEKPIAAADEGEARALLDACEGAGVQLMDGTM